MSRMVTTILAILGAFALATLMLGPQHIPAMARWESNPYAPDVFFIGLAGELGGIALLLAAYIGALVKLAQLQQTRWLVALCIGLGLALTGIGVVVTGGVLLAYCVFGPTTHAIPRST